MKTFWISPGDSSVNPSTYTGLSPTMIILLNNAGGTAIPPGITESPAGTGVYSFVYGPTIGMFFTVDWGIGLPSIYRYTKGSIDPIQAVDERVGGILNNNDSYGTTATDPSTVIGYLKRALEIAEGNAIYTKSTGIWDIYSRGSTTLLREKSLSNNTSQANKS